jgi:DNA-binding transcriptional MerR regulator
MRIGELAREVGTTVRTIRYYEEIGLLAGGTERVAGAHRTYTEHDAEHLRELIRLKELLGISLDELREVAADEGARALLREEFRDDGTSVARRRRILDEFERILERQLELVARRRAQLDQLESELLERRGRVELRRAELRAASPRRRT